MPVNPTELISPICAFQDNYIWMIKNSADKSAFVVDPGDAVPVFETLNNQGLTLTGILVTHHHYDHTGGISELLAAYPVPVYGPKASSFKLIDHRLSEGDLVQVYGFDFTVMELPGHTLDHIAYFSHNTKPPVLFCGDTLFVSGCGRVFEGTFEQMHHSLMKLSELPPATLVYCAHEYTLANLDFAKIVDGTNTDLKDFLSTTQQIRKKHAPTVPSSIEMELAINPFLRTDKASIKKAAEDHANKKLSSPVAVFNVIRSWKDSF
jgi:hydroxyacylglutathione hydrolase